MSWLWIPWFCVVLCFHFPCPLMCPLSSPENFPMFPLVSFCLLGLFTPCFVLCAPPPRYLTWPPLFSLSSPIPLRFISVCVFSVSLPCSPCPFTVSVCISSCLCLCLPLILLLFMLLSVSSPLMVCFGFEFCIFELNFAFWLYFVLPLFLLLLCLLSLFVFCNWLPWFLYSALN